MRIGELAQRSGVSVRSLRYYEERELIAPSHRVNGQRRYERDAVERVRLLRDLLAAGLGTAAIADILPCMADPSAQTSSLTRRLMSERDRITEEIEQRIATRAALEQLIESTPELNS
jgi:DNA-binding transcriptional MerR regulator